MSDHPDDTHPDMRPDDALSDQLKALAMWVGDVLADEHACRQYALERAGDYLLWLAYRAEQVTQQHRMALLPVDPAVLNAAPSGLGEVAMPGFPRR
ncbi:hypothetical protein Cme02nite_20810 [Catellatospora methionotrophica]|uniref:Uncharacterized protein n=1 Tax=Catellatospora methionotrophica TaxID=121620 RepID=A0A8J3LDY9_9ACTN|nr:hypothetical protein [Catellatospora methionotrophica]GIG13749.1 hypothetical protein Cme02nite_20810 [Catellatospora methionotrophica]